jgi:ribosomal protein S18 acetylase RimI-like enzyme
MRPTHASSAAPDTRLRDATSDDAAALAEFGARTFFETFAADNTPEDMRQHLESTWAPERQRREILDPSMRTLLAVTADGALAAFAQLRLDHAPACVSTVRAVELMRFYVDRPWHGSGLARTLMAAVESRGRQLGARELWLGVWQRNARARAFYAKCGFGKVGTQVFVVGSDPQTDDVMLKPL